MKKTLCLFCLFIVSAANAAAVQCLDSLLRVLDEELKHYPRYERNYEAEIDRLRQRYLQAEENSMEKYALGREMFSLYRRFEADSARAYLVRNIECANACQRPDLALRNRLDLTFFYACTGLFAEAYQLLQQFHRSEIPDSLLSLYYNTHCKLYQELERFGVDEELNRMYRRKLLAYSDSLRHVGHLPTEDSYWVNRFDNLFRADRADECLRLLDSVPRNERLHAQLAWLVGSEYENHRGDTLRAMCYYAQASVSDLRSCTRDHGALPLLSEYLLEHNDLEHAYRYIDFSWRQTSLFGSRLRYNSSVSVFSLVESTYKEVVKRRQDMLTMLIAGISVLLLLLFVLLRVLFRQLRKTSRAKDLLHDSNRHLEALSAQIQEVNRELEKSNERLQLTSSIKEKYLMHFIQLCSTYITDLDEYRRKIRIMLKRDAKAALQYAESPELFDSELNKLYSSFDQAFLQIFPGFVDAFNNMLKDEYRIKRKGTELLTTELRIFALIKLGVTDYEQMAKFLRCSVNTIYNYRAKIHSRLKVPREEFDSLLVANG